MKHWIIGIVVFVGILAILDYSDNMPRIITIDILLKAPMTNLNMPPLYAETVHTVIVQIDVVLAHIMVA